MKFNSMKAMILRKLMNESDYERIFSKPLDKKRRALIFKAGMARLFGRHVNCHACGGCLGKAIVRVNDGDIEIWGLHEGTVRVSFKDRVTLRFAHVHAEQCPPMRKKIEP